MILLDGRANCETLHAPALAVPPRSCDTSRLSPLRYLSTRSLKDSMSSTGSSTSAILVVSVQ